VRSASFLFHGADLDLERMDPSVARSALLDEGLQ
jgi:hypothetical protein